MKTFSLCANALIVSGLLGAAAAGAFAQDNYHAQAFSLPHVKEHIIPIDMNGDGRRDLLTSGENVLSVYLQGPQGRFQFEKADAVLELPGNAVGWDLDYVPAQSGAGERLVRVLALVDGKTLLSWSLNDDKFGEPQTVLKELGGFLPAGAYPLKLVRDINEDGRNDLMVPASAQLYLYLQREDGAYGPGLPVKTNVWVESQLDTDGSLTDKVGQRVRVPRIRLRDLNNDGRNDLIAWSDRVLEVYLAGANGGYPSRASYRFDGNEVDERVGDVDIDKVDFSNLSGLLAYTWDFELADMDGDKIEDLLLREGGKVTLYGGTAEGINFEQPRQVLKSGGNVLAALMVDEDDDGVKDLWLMRIESVSLGNVFVWLAVSGSLDIETFVYKNEGERFARRPSRKITLTVKFPSILRSVNLVNDAFDPERSKPLVRFTKARLEGDERENDMFVLQERAIAAYVDAIKTEAGSKGILGLPNYSPNKDNYAVDLQDYLAHPEEAGDRDLAQIRSREPDFRIALGEEAAERIDLQQADLCAVELNGDGRDDIFLFLERDDTRVDGILYLSAPETEQATE